MMPTRRRLILTNERDAQPTDTRRLHPKADLRERAAAILKIAAGVSPHAVATTGLWFPRAPDTVYAWLAREEREGLAGLAIKQGCGRKPAFSPAGRDGRRRPRGRAPHRAA
jgi:hypothetical protein